jgi:hypothetical protein
MRGYRLDIPDRQAALSLSYKNRDALRVTHILKKTRTTKNKTMRSFALRIVSIRSIHVKEELGYQATYPL